jgi:hypothetical protein
LTIDKKARMVIKKLLPEGQHSWSLRDPDHIIRMGAVLNPVTIFVFKSKYKPWRGRSITFTTMMPMTPEQCIDMVLGEGVNDSWCESLNIDPFYIKTRKLNLLPMPFDYLGEGGKKRWLSMMQRESE